MTQSLPLFTLESRIKRQFRGHLKALGFVRLEDGQLAPPDESKDTCRAMHRVQRQDRLQQERAFVSAAWQELSSHFAEGIEVVPAAIRARLELVTADTWQSRLFRLASLTWSVPVSQGYGRRMRFLVWDDSNNKLIGLIALGDPVFNLRVRDELIGWNVEERRQRLVNVLDAFTLGALPPYNMLLGGKLVASLVRTTEVRNAFASRYSATRGLISHQRKHAALLMVTTSSALGRSSIYNRLVLGGTRYFNPIGFTAGWGHFHIPDGLFALIRQYLAAHDNEYAANNRFGDGPNWRLRAIRRALGMIGLNEDLLRHGVTREVYACFLATNAARVLAGDAKRPKYDDLLSVSEVADAARERWMEPRAARRHEYSAWRRAQIFDLLNPGAVANCQFGDRRAHGAG